MTQNLFALPTAEDISAWAEKTGFTKARIKEIYREIIDDPEPWGPNEPFEEDW